MVPKGGKRQDKETSLSFAGPVALPTSLFVGTFIVHCSSYFIVCWYKLFKLLQFFIVSEVEVEINQWAIACLLAFTCDLSKKFSLTREMASSRRRR